MNIIDVWLNVSKRILFFTKETRDQIPEKPGIYAWFFPLWLYKDDIVELVDLLNKMILYDARCEGIPKQASNVKFNWSQVKVQLTKAYTRSINPDSSLKKRWDEVIQDNEAKEALSQTLMEASIFMPPLYVGKTRNLKSRYFQHVKGTAYEKSDFHKRFTEHANELIDELPIMISDLLFACIITDSKTNKVFNSEDINDFIETIILKVCT